MVRAYLCVARIQKFNPGDFAAELMGYNARNDEIYENLERMRRERAAYQDTLAIVRQCKARLSAKKTVRFWPTVGAALASKHQHLENLKTFDSHRS